MKRDLRDRLLQALVGQPLVDNAFRGTLVEAMLAEVLEPDWRWCSAGWAAYDFESNKGVGLEVKQSAALQSWHELGYRPNQGRFDIAERTGRYEGAKWIPGVGRAAAIYVFAWHPQTDRVIADHRDPHQWQFYVVATKNLPVQKTIGHSSLKRLAEPVGIEAVALSVRSCVP